MKNVAKAVVVGLVLVPMVFLGGCAKRCGDPAPCKVERIVKEYHGK